MHPKYYLIGTFLCFGLFYNAAVNSQSQPLMGSIYEDISEGELGISVPPPSIVTGQKINVNGVEIPPNVYSAFIYEQMSKGTPDTPKLREAVREELIRREILNQEAKNKGIDSSDNIKGQLNLAEQAVLVRAQLKKITSSGGDDTFSAKSKTDEYIASLVKSADIDFVKHSVSGVPIEQAVFNAFLADQVANGKVDNQKLRETIWSELIRREAIYKDAAKSGLNKDPIVSGQVFIARNAVIIRVFLNDYVKSNPISEDDLRRDYEVIRSNLGDTEYKARHILVPTDIEARAVISKLANGERFEDLARISKDSNSSSKGGELAWSSPSTYTKPFGDALKLLQKGDTTKDPVKSDFGYHIIRLDDKRPLVVPSFEKVRPQLIKRSNQKTVEKLVKDLRSKAIVK